MHPVRPAALKANVLVHGGTAPRAHRGRPHGAGYASAAVLAILIFALSALLLHSVVTNADTHSHEIIRSNPGADGGGSIARWMAKWRGSAKSRALPSVALNGSSDAPAPQIVSSGGGGGERGSHASAAAAACPMCDWLDNAGQRIRAESAVDSAEAGRKGGPSSSAAMISSYVGSKRAALQALRLVRSLTERLSSDIASASPLLEELAAGILPPDAPHEDDVIFPEPTTSKCIMQGDSFDICTYENICIDAPGPYSIERWDLPGAVYFIKSDVLNAGDTDASNRAPPPRKGRSPSATMSPLPRRVVTHPTLGGDSLGDRIDRHARREAQGPNWNVSGLVRTREWQSYDVVYVDIADTSVGFTPRVMPWAIRLRPVTIEPSETVSLAHGGTFNGTVTWVDNLYITMDMLGPHLWGFGSTTAFPLFGAWVANYTQDLKLPPLDNLIIMNTDAYKKDRLELSTPFEWFNSAESRWALGFLDALLSYIQLPPPGPPPAFPLPQTPRPSAPPPFTGKLVEGKGGHYPLLEELLARAFADAGLQPPPAYNGTTYDGSGGEYDAVERVLAAALKSAAAATGGKSSTAALPHEFLRMKNTHPGTRVIWNILDLPVPPSPYTHPDATLPRVNTMRRRICTKRGVILGERPTLITGPVEANAVREFGHYALNVPRVADDMYMPAPERVLVIDRGKVMKYGIKPRGFSNIDEMLAVLQKYRLPYDLLTDKNMTKMGIAAQAQLIGQYGLVVMAHGAGETNLAFLPRRAAIIEVSPVLLWCPLYHRYLLGLGHALFPIFSRLKGPLLTWNVWGGINMTEREKEELAVKCEGKSLTNIARMQCWHEAKNAAVTTPIHEFEHVLLRALDVIGIKKFPLNSSYDLLEGVRQGGPDVPFWSEGHYEAARWKVCPPSSTCAAAPTAM